MHLNRIHQSFRGTLALAAFFTLTVAVPAATQSSAADVPSTPPAYPDKTHVSNGCHLSSITYLARLQAKYPAEHGEPLVIRVVNYDGSVTSHTIALLSWQGQLWCRDEYFGVFPLDCAVHARPDHDQLVAKAEMLLERHEKKLIRAGSVTLCPVPPKQMSSEQRTTAVKVIAQGIPFATTVYWVRSGSQDIPLAFFRPARGKIAVYDPQHGTCLAECATIDQTKIVSSVAARFGYRVDALRIDDTIPLEMLFAVSPAVSGGAQ